MSIRRRRSVPKNWRGLRVWIDLRNLRGVREKKTFPLIEFTELTNKENKLCGAGGLSPRTSHRENTEFEAGVTDPVKKSLACLEVVKTGDASVIY